MNFRELIVESGKTMVGKGLTVETYGNISCRDPETGHIYLTPSAMAYDKITPEDVIVCDPKGRIVEGKRKPTIEMGMHISIYNSRPDANAVLHTHPIYSLVYASMGRDIPLFTDEAVQVLMEPVRCAKYALPGSQELAENIAAALGTRGKACLARCHGAVCLGTNMKDAFKTAAVLEMTAQIYYMIESIGQKPVGISPENIEKMQDFIRNSYGQ